jgi:ribosomal protein L2
VERIEHDPGRSAHIALLRSKLTGKLSYILAADGMRAGEVVESYRSGIPDHLLDSMGGSVDPGVLAAKTAWRGNCLPLTMVPVGSLIFNIGLYKGKAGQLCRGAGTYGILLAKAGEIPDDLPQRIAAGIKAGRKATEQDESGDRRAVEPAADNAITEQEYAKLKKLSDHVTIRLSSGEVRLIHKECCATIGVASNSDHKYAQLGKAGRSRWLNIRPTVRGVAMNAKDHPHGGGRGKSKGGVPSKSPWGKPVSQLIKLLCS